MKKRITIRIDEDILGWFREKGGNYQTRINDVLRKHIGSKCDCGKVGVVGCDLHDHDEPIQKESMVGEYVPGVDIPDPYFRPMPKKGGK